MCSRNAEKDGSSGFQGAERTGSMAARLAWYHVATTCVLLLLAAGYLYHSLKTSFEERDLALIRSKAQVLRHLLLEYRTRPDMLKAEVEHEASPSQPLRYYLRVLDSENRVIAETEEMARRLPSGAFPPAVAEEDAEMPVPVVHGEHLLATVRTRVSSANGTGEASHVLQIALDTTPQKLLLRRFRDRLLAVLLIGLLVSVGAGIVLARRGLRPIAAITSRTGSIKASRLHERVGAQPWPAELKELAGAFDAMLDRLEASFGQLDRFASDLAHELRNPLSNLRGEAEVALARAREPREYQEVLASSLEELQRLSRMVDDLLFLARAENPRAALERRAIDAGAEIAAVCDYYEGVAEDKGVRVEMRGGGRTLANQALFRQAVGNLLDNALAHTPPGGCVTLFLEERPEEGLEVRVCDTGAGIPAEALPRVFERFFRLETDDRARRRGAGLGLAIVRTILQLHGGTAEATSAPGEGTCFTLRFPPVRPEGPPKSL